MNDPDPAPNRSGFQLTRALARREDQRGALPTDTAGDASAAPSSNAPAPTRPPTIDVDAAMVAKALGLDVPAFQALMRAGKIRTLSERGVGQDEGRFRLSFYYLERRLRLITDAAGEVIARQG